MNAAPRAKTKLTDLLNLIFAVSTFLQLTLIDTNTPAWPWEIFLPLLIIVFCLWAAQSRGANLHFIKPVMITSLFGVLFLASSGSMIYCRFFTNEGQVFPVYTSISSSLSIKSGSP